MAKINLSLLGKAWKRIKTGLDWFANKAVLSTRTPVSNSYRPLNRELSAPASQTKVPTGTYLDKMPGMPKPQVVQTTKPYVIENLPGYMIRSLMRENPLEKQLSKQGTISINSILAHAQKGNAMEKEIINKVLQEQFAGQDRIDYNAFRRAVQKQIPQYNRVPQTDYNTYGMERLGFKESKQPDGAGGIISYVPGVRTATFTFESPGIKGNTTHYKGSPIGHSRTYTTPEEPSVLHVMESQSDWAQRSRGLTRTEKLALANIDEEIAHIKSGGEPRGFDDLPALEKKKQKIISEANARKGDLQQEYLKDTYLERQLQENLLYAAENGHTKMRYPARETAAKIEGYQKVVDGTAWYKIEADEASEMSALNESTKHDEWYSELRDLDARWEKLTPKEKARYDYLRKMDKEYLAKFREIRNKASERKKELINNSTNYSSKDEGILRKYDAFPKIYQKLYKDADVRIVTDPKGNTWYEVDVPNNYLNMEWQYKQGGSINYLNYF